MPASPLMLLLKNAHAAGGLHRIEFPDEFFPSVEDVETWLESRSFTVEDGETISKSGNRWVAVIRRESKFEDGDRRFEPLPFGEGVIGYVGVPKEAPRKPPARSGRAIEGGQVTPEQVDLNTLIEKQDPTDEMTDEQAQEAQKERAGRFAVEILDGAALRFPKDYPTDLEDYGDPVNLKYPLVPEGRLKNALSRFAQNYDEYERPRSRKIVFSRIVSRALDAGIAVDPESDMVKTYLAPDLKRKVQDAADKAKEATQKSAPIMKLELDGGSVQDLMDLLYRAMSAASKTGIFGSYDVDGDYFPGSIMYVGDSTLVVNNYRDNRYYQATWKRGEGTEVTLSDVQEVRMVISWDTIGQPANDTTLVIRTSIVKVDLDGGSVQALMDNLERAVRTAARAGIFGQVSDDWCQVYVRGIFDETVVVTNYREGKYYQANWSRNEDRSITISGVVEVRAVETYQEVGPGPMGDSVVTTKDALEAVGVLKSLASTLVLVTDPLQGALDGFVKLANAFPELRSVMKRDGSNTVRLVPIAKLDAPNRTITYEVYRPDARDTHKDWMSAEQIYKSMVFWMENSQEFDADHDFAKREARVIENWQLKEDWVMGDESFPTGTWMQTTKILDDALWASIEKGEYNYVSIAGTAKAVPGSKPVIEKSAGVSVEKEDAELQDMEVWKVSFVRRGANSGQGVKPFSIFKSADQGVEALEQSTISSVFDSTSHARAESKPGFLKRLLKFVGLSGPEESTSKREHFLKELEELISQETTMTVIKKTLEQVALFIKENHEKDPVSVKAALKELGDGVTALSAKVEELHPVQKTTGDNTEVQKAACPKCEATMASDAKFCSACGSAMKAEKTEKTDKPVETGTPAQAATPAVDLAKTVQEAVAQATAPLAGQLTALQEKQLKLEQENAKLKTDKSTVDETATRQAELLKQAGLTGTLPTTPAPGGGSESTPTQKSADPWGAVENFGQNHWEKDVLRKSTLKTGEGESDSANEW